MAQAVSTRNVFPGPETDLYQVRDKDVQQPEKPQAGPSKRKVSVECPEKAGN